MMSGNSCCLVFGGSYLQKSIILECVKSNLTTILIDPDNNPVTKNEINFFEVVNGDDFDGTCRIIEKYNIDAIITSATDKPLLMMSRIAKKYGFPFFSENTALITTDKYLMKKVFIQAGIPCTNGILSKQAKSPFSFPVIVKPRDNSGSRGVYYCKNKIELEKAFSDALAFTQKDTILIEEYIDGKEYSVESLHFGGKSHVLQITEKFTTEPPYNVELEHLQPANISASVKDEIVKLIEHIATTLEFDNCGSHTELKIGNKGITIIETSPRLGGDFITSHLVPLSTGINMEKALIDISLGKTPQIKSQYTKSSMVRFLEFPQRVVKKVNKDFTLPEDVIFECILSPGGDIPLIKNSFDRYAYIILSSNNRHEMMEKMEQISKNIYCSYFL